jgi:hypothetical protein
MTAGRELDGEVAQKVMGWVDVGLKPIANAFGQHVIDEWAGVAPEGTGRPSLVPRFSTMIQDAWPVVEKMRREFAFVAVISGKGPSGPASWVCKVNRDGGFIEEKGETAPLAICLAALRAFPRPGS